MAQVVQVHRLVDAGRLLGLAPRLGEVRPIRSSTLRAEEDSTGRTDLGMMLQVVDDFLAEEKSRCVRYESTS